MRSQLPKGSFSEEDPVVECDCSASRDGHAWGLWGGKREMTVRRCTTWIMNGQTGEAKQSRSGEQENEGVNA